MLKKNRCIKVETKKKGKNLLNLSRPGDNKRLDDGNKRQLLHSL